MAPEGIPGQQVLREKLAPLARPDLRDQWGPEAAPEYLALPGPPEPWDLRVM